MSDYFELLGCGSEKTGIERASEEMLRAAESIQESLARHEKFLDDWLRRFERAANNTGLGD